MLRSPLGIGALGALVLLTCAGLIVGLAPAGVPTTIPVLQMLGLSITTALLSLAVARLVYKKLGTPPWHAHRAAWLIACVVCVGVTTKVTHDLDTGRQLSADLVTPAPHLGPGAAVLRANLKQAKVVAPDRPHSPEEVTSPDRWERMRRTRSFTVSTNSLGLRSPELASPAAGQRILCIGDSVTMGWGVADDQTYPAHLARILGTEVINAGMPAMKPHVIGAWLGEHAKSLGLDVVVLAVRPNHAVWDPWTDYKHALQAAADAVAPAKVLVVLPPLSTFDPLGHRMGATEATRIKEIAGAHPVLDLTPAFRSRQQSGVVMQMAGETQQMRVLPSKSLVAEGIGEGDQLAAELVAAFENDPGVKEAMFFDGGHPDAPGYKLMADEVARTLLSQGWIRPQSP